MENKNPNKSELTEEELEKVTAGINWAAFGQEVLGKADPTQYPELIAAIASQNWIKVALLSIPLIAAGVQPFVTIFKQT